MDMSLQAYLNLYGQPDIEPEPVSIKAPPASLAVPAGKAPPPSGKASAPSLGVPRMKAPPPPLHGQAVPHAGPPPSAVAKHVPMYAPPMPPDDPPVFDHDLCLEIVNSQLDRLYTMDERLRGELVELNVMMDELLDVRDQLELARWRAGPGRNHS